MNKEKLIEMIEAELVKADQAQNDVAFDKHIYAIHTLTALYTNTDDRAKSSSRDITHTAVQMNASTKQATSSQSVTDEEIRLMGGKVSPSKTTTSNARMVTDDEIGNGESLFDF
ncbi:DUF5327 family protein [Staphylococcus chromogenes]|uniref:DUF5327 family protein n=1 Tax=Staphylococcus chromogenes TaxID=46126 RepID=UPI003D79AB11